MEIIPRGGKSLQHPNCCKETKRWRNWLDGRKVYKVPDQQKKFSKNSEEYQKLSKDQDVSMMVKYAPVEKCEEKWEKETMLYLDNGCFRHMTGDSTRFINISYKTSDHVTYRDNNKGKIVGIGKIKTPSSYVIENALMLMSWNIIFIA